jgi:hypothetical protein
MDAQAVDTQGRIREAVELSQKQFTFVDGQLKVEF